MTDIFYYKSASDCDPIRLEKSWDIPGSSVSLYKVRCSFPEFAILF